MISENKDIREVKSFEEIVDCIQTKIYDDFPLKTIQAFEQLPKNNIGDYFRIAAIPYLFHKTEEIIKGENNPIDEFKKALNGLLKTINHINYDEILINFYSNLFENNQLEIFNDEIKNHTGQHYGNLFKKFDHKSYFDEARDLLETRLKRNDIDIDNIENKTLLDQGCGGGRYTIAWKLLGVKKAVGLDFSEIGLTDAKARADFAGINDVDFIKGSVLEMPFEDESFDIVFSNGVLHHTEDWRKGIQEQLRVMKSGGFGWQYLIENPGGVLWDSVEILRAIVKDINKKNAQDVLCSLGISMNRVFYMLDHVMVPINTRLTSEEIIEELENNGATNIRRLNRGVDFDRIEAINNKIPFAKEKFGIGENRFIFTKK
jgi:ubiquinone/menaquinone biosynthesis C-methylase UbiE